MITPKKMREIQTKLHAMADEYETASRAVHKTAIERDVKELLTGDEFRSMAAENELFIGFVVYGPHMRRSRLLSFIDRKVLG